MDILSSEFIFNSISDNVSQKNTDDIINSSLPPGEWYSQFSMFDELCNIEKNNNTFYLLKELMFKINKIENTDPNYKTIISKHPSNLTTEEAGIIFKYHSYAAALGLTKASSRGKDRNYSFIKKDLASTGNINIGLSKNNLLAPFIQIRSWNENNSFSEGSKIEFKNKKLYDELKPSYEHSGNNMTTDLYSYILNPNFNENQYLNNCSLFEEVSSISEKDILPTDNSFFEGTLFKILKLVLLLKIKNTLDIKDSNTLKNIENFINDNDKLFFSKNNSGFNSIRDEVFVNLFSKLKFILSPQFIFKLNSPSLEILFSALSIYAINKMIENAESNNKEDLENYIFLIKKLSEDPNNINKNSICIIKNILNYAEECLEFLPEIFGNCFSSSYDLGFTQNRKIKEFDSNKKLNMSDFSGIFYYLFELCKKTDDIRWFEPSMFQINCSENNIKILKRFAISLYEATLIHNNSFGIKDILDDNLNSEKYYSGDYSKYFIENLSLDSMDENQKYRMCSSASYFSTNQIFTSLAMSIFISMARFNEKIKISKTNSNLLRPKYLITLWKQYTSHSKYLYHKTFSLNNEFSFIHKTKTLKLLADFRIWIRDSYYYWYNYNLIDNSKMNLLLSYDDLAKYPFSECSELVFAGHPTGWVIYPIAGPYFLSVATACIKFYTSKEKFLIPMIKNILEELFYFASDERCSDLFISEYKFNSSDDYSYSIFLDEFKNSLSFIGKDLFEKTFSYSIISFFNSINQIFTLPNIKQELKYEFSDENIYSKIDNGGVSLLPFKKDFLSPVFINSILNGLCSQEKIKKILINVVYFAKFTELLLNDYDTCYKTYKNVKKFDFIDKNNSYNNSKVLPSLLNGLFANEKRNDLIFGNFISLSKNSFSDNILDHYFSKNGFSIINFYHNPFVILFNISNCISNNIDVFKFKTSTVDFIFKFIYMTYIIPKIINSENITDENDISGKIDALLRTSPFFDSELLVKFNGQINDYYDKEKELFSYLKMIFNPDFMIPLFYKTIVYKWNYKEIITYIRERFVYFSTVKNSVLKLEELLNPKPTEKPELLVQIKHESPVSKNTNDTSPIVQEEIIKEEKIKNIKKPILYNQLYNKIKNLSTTTDEGLKLKNKLLDLVVLMKNHRTLALSNLLIDNKILSEKSLSNR